MRRKDREVTDMQKILEILRTSKFLHLGLIDKDFPYIVPMHYGFEQLDHGMVFYMHCAKEGHKLDLIQENPNVCVELECNVSLIPGGEITCEYGATYASFIGRGQAELVQQEQEKIRGLLLLMEHQTGRKFTIDSKMATAVEVIKVTVRDFTAKARTKL